jgi:hypothetical protein
VKDLRDLMRRAEWTSLSPTLVMDVSDGYLDLLEQGVRHPPLGRLTFTIVARIVDGTPRDLTPPLEMVVTKNPSNFYLFFGALKLSKTANGAEREIRNHMLDDGTYVMRLTSDFYQMIQGPVTLPQPKQPIRIPLSPGYSYPFFNSYPLHTGAPDGCPTNRQKNGHGPTLLRGTINMRDGRGLPNATVQVPGFDATYRTDSTGQWVLVIDPQALPLDAVPRQVTLQIRLPNDIVINVTNVCLVPGRETIVRQAALRGAVLDKGMPVEGARISIVGAPDSITTAADGSWAYYLDFAEEDAFGLVAATLPDGRSLMANVRTVHRSTVIVPTFRFS